MRLLGNSYVLGFLMLLAEALVNLVAGFTFISGVPFSFAAGSFYSWRNKVRMPRSEKLKAIAVYSSIVALFAFLIVAFKPDVSLGMGIIVLVIVLLVGMLSLFIYLGLTFGSDIYMKAYEKKIAATKQ